jgi:hypothetical protein
MPGDVEAPGDNNVSPEQDITLPSGNSSSPSSSSAAAAPNTAYEQNAGQSKRIAHTNIQ